MKKMNKKGFTLMEMLIVVAIIAILIAIAIPTFTKQLEKSRESADAANLRSAYAEVVAEALGTGNGSSVSVVATQKQAEGTNGWQTSNLSIGDLNVPTFAKTTKGWTVSCTDEGVVTMTSYRG